MSLIGLNYTNLSMPLSTVGLFADDSGSKAAAYDACITCASHARLHQLWLILQRYRLTSHGVD